jgi:transcriptional activator of cad operon
LRQKSLAGVIDVGAWRAVRATGELISDGRVERLEPKVMDLLFLLAARPGQVITRDEIMTALWPNVIVGDDTLARAVSRLRKALADDAKEPAYIETLPKRGYRLIAEVRSTPVTPVNEPEPSSRFAGRRRIALGTMAGIAAVLLIATFAWPQSGLVDDPANRLVERANDFYFQYKRADNEAAIALFERILAERPDHVPALAGLANALVQRVIRWPDIPGAPEYTQLGEALESGRTKTATAVPLLHRATMLASRAVTLGPKDPTALKALGFVQSAAGDFKAAITTYQRAVAIDADAWGPLINIGDVLEISGRAREALPYFEQAYAAMTRLYDKETARIRPWYAELAVLIGDRYRDTGAVAAAESWYRRVLVYAPLHRTATERLAGLLRNQGELASAGQLCANLTIRTGAVCR